MLLICSKTTESRTKNAGTNVLRDLSNVHHYNFEMGKGRAGVVGEDCGGGGGIVGKRNYQNDQFPLKKKKNTEEEKHGKRATKKKYMG